MLARRHGLDEGSDMLPKSWKSRPAGGLVRLGSDDDGGYVVAPRAVRDSTVLLSMGLNDDWRFERDFRAASGARVICLDHTVDGKFWIQYVVKQLGLLRLSRALRAIDYRRFFASQAVQHRRIKVGYDQPGETSLATLLAELDGERIFLKVDIEGSEYRIFNDLARHADRFTGIVLELHDVDLNRGRIDDLLARLDAFEVVFLHANNFGGVDAAGDPIVLEIALMRRDYIDPPRAGETPPPTPANDASRADIALRFC